MCLCEIGRKHVYREASKAVVPKRWIVLWPDGSTPTGAPLRYGHATMFGGAAVDTQKHADAKTNIVAGPERVPGVE